MDHFNSTIKDGKLVNTRRGLQVSRQKFNGLSFVNTSAQDTTRGQDTFPVTEGSMPPLRQVKFVETGKVQRQGTELNFISDSGQGKKPRRRANPREQRLPTSPSCSSSSRRSPRSSSLTPSNGEVSGQYGPLAGAQVNFAIGPRATDTESSASPPSAWNTQEALSEHEWKLFHRYYPEIPRQSYPHEDVLDYNPIRGDDFYSIVTSDVAALHSVLMCGTIMEAVVNSETDPKGFSYHISKICAILNRKLDQNQAADAITLHCIATLAWMGCYVGRLDHWHMHMRGLQKVLDVSGGLDGLPPWLLDKIHIADLKGAAALASTPYLPFSRQYGTFSTAVSIDVREHASTTLNSLLRPLNVDQEVIDGLSSLAAFAFAFGLARRSGKSATFDPRLFTEEWQAIMHALITRPGPLREVDSESTDNPYLSGTQDGSASSDSSSTGSVTENYMNNHRLRTSAAVIPTCQGNHIESALRIAGLLFLKELLPDYPRNLGGYAVMLSLLRQNLQAILEELDPTAAAVAAASANRDLADDDSNLLVCPSPPRPEPEELKPVIIFLAVMGNISSLLADENEGRMKSSSNDRYDRAVYGECLRKLARLTSSEESKLVTNEELAMVKLFDLRTFLVEGKLVVDGGMEGANDSDAKDEQEQWEEVWSLLLRTEDDTQVR